MNCLNYICSLHRNFYDAVSENEFGMLVEDFGLQDTRSDSEFCWKTFEIHHIDPEKVSSCDTKWYSNDRFFITVSVVF